MEPFLDPALNSEFQDITIYLTSLQNAVQNKSPHNSISLGDGEMIFLMHPELRFLPNYNFFMVDCGTSGISDYLKQRIKTQLINYFFDVDFFFGQKLYPTWESLQENEMGKDTTGKYAYRLFQFLEYYKIPYKGKILDNNQRYEMITNGSLFNTIAGSRVLLVGFFAPIVEKLFKNPNFINHYKSMNADKIEVVGSVFCRRNQGLLDIPHMLNEIAEYKDKFDVALIGAGMVGVYINAKIKEIGKIAIDIGHPMQAFAGFGELKRNHMGEFDFIKNREWLQNVPNGEPHEIEPTL